MAGGRVNRMSVAVACRRRAGDASASSRRVRMKDGAGAVVMSSVRLDQPADRLWGSMLVISLPPPIIPLWVRSRR